MIDRSGAWIVLCALLVGADPALSLPAAPDTAPTAKAEPVLPPPDFGEFGVPAPRPQQEWSFPWENEESESINEERQPAGEKKDAAEQH